MRRLLAVLKTCKSQDIHLKANGTRLEVRGSSTPELREELSYHKPNMLAYLRTGRCHHELEPEKCKVCSGEVRRLIEETLTQ
jgi:hypothetical protein